MSIFSFVTLMFCVSLAWGQTCTNNNLGLNANTCQRCGRGRLDDFCVKSYGKCGDYVVQPSNSNFQSFERPPYGYLSGGTLPSSCSGILAAASRIPGVFGTTGNTRVYEPAGLYSEQLPGVFVQPNLYQFLPMVTSVNCMDSEAPFPNGVWNVPNNYARMDSFMYYDTVTGNMTWSYQCYCDFCNSCQSCTNG